MTMFLSSAFSLLLAATVTSVPAPGLAVSDINAAHGSILQTKAMGDDAPGYFAISNDGQAPDTLTAWTCPNAQTTALVDGQGKPLPNLTIPPRQTVTLAANGPHLILQDMHFTVDRGSIVPCALTFVNEGQIQVLLYAVDQKKKG